MRTSMIAISGLLLTVSCMAAADAQTDALVKKMVSACGPELKADPALSDVSDGEAVWKNIEAKEQADKISKKCDAAEEKYEMKFHPDVYKGEVETDKIVDAMVKACKAELWMAPTLKDISDREAVWNNLEAKEQAGKLSKKCDAAEEKYEQKFHPDVYKIEEAKEHK